jgi:hypothetical protein
MTPIEDNFRAAIFNLARDGREKETAELLKMFAETVIAMAKAPRVYTAFFAGFDNRHHEAIVKACEIASGQLHDRAFDHAINSMYPATK